MPGSLLEESLEEADEPPELQLLTNEDVVDMVAHHGSYEHDENEENSVLLDNGCSQDAERIVTVDDGLHKAEGIFMIADGSHTIKGFLDQDEMEMMAIDDSHDDEDEEEIVVDDDGDNDDEGLVECDPTGRYCRYAEVLGRGAMKTVYKGYDMVDCKEVAWNKAKLPISGSQEQATAIVREVQLLKGLNHRGILKLFTSWVDTEHNTMNSITELCSSSLLAYRMKHKHVSKKAVKSWARQILSGLAYLHAQNPLIIHRDLKCENILVKCSSSMALKIGDFGSSAVLDETHHMHALVGTPEFMAPEMFQEDYNELVDVYSFGMCMIELITRECPYSECKSIAEIYKNVTRDVKPKALLKIKDEQALRFINRCLLPAPQRPSAMALLLDPFLNCMEVSHDLGVSIHAMKESMSVPNLTSFASKKSVPAAPNLMASDKNGAPKTSTSAPNLMASDKNGAPKTSTTKENAVEVVRSPDLVRKNNTGMSDCVPEKSTRVLNCNRKRSFRVMGKVEDVHTIRLKLRIQALSRARDIVFPFHLENDSPRSVAEEMVRALNYPESDVVTIAELINEEVRELSTADSQLVPDTDMGVLMDSGVTTASQLLQNDGLSDFKPLGIDEAASMVQHVCLDVDGSGSNNTRAAKQNDWGPLSKKLHQLPFGIRIALGSSSSAHCVRRPLQFCVGLCG